MQARRSEDVDAFIEALEKTGSFRDVITPAEAINERRPARRDDQGDLSFVAEATAWLATCTGSMLVQRVTREHRRVDRAAGDRARCVNVIVYGVVVYPLSQRVANIEQRDRTAEAQLLAAQREHAQADRHADRQGPRGRGARDVLQGRAAVRISPARGG